MDKFGGETMDASPQRTGGMLPASDVVVLGFYFVLCLAVARSLGLYEGMTRMIAALGGAKTALAGDLLIAFLFLVPAGAMLARRRFNYLKQELDIRIRAEEALRISEAKLRHIYEFSPVMLSSVDAAGRIVNVNFRWQEEMGYTLDEVLGRSMAEFFPPRACEDGGGGFWADEGAKDLLVQVVRRDGQTIDLMVHCLVGIDPAGRKTGLCAAQNITEQRRAYAALKAERDELLLRLQEGAAVAEQRPALGEDTPAKGEDAPLRDDQKNPATVPDVAAPRDVREAD